MFFKYLLINLSIEQNLCWQQRLSSRQKEIGQTDKMLPGLLTGERRMTDETLSALESSVSDMTRQTESGVTPEHHLLLLSL